ncbi:MAG: hypothetical protein JEZ08_23605 [Clostridiales bacterium]|nr:hypothetical protein [Clostridiales bacterium]
MKEQSRSQRRADRKIREKKFLEKYKDEAPKGPGFTWQAKLIFGAIGLLIILGFVFGKSLYVGSTPIKLLDYSLTRSMKTVGRDIDLDITYHSKNVEESFELDTNIQYTFEYIKALIDMEGTHIPKQKLFINTDSIMTDQNGDWEKYNFNQLVIKDQTDISWLAIEQVLDLRSIPAVEDTFEEYAQYFITAFYDRFTYGESKSIVTPEKTYETKRIDATITEEDFYPFIKDFLTFNDNMIDFREGVKDRVKRFLEAIQKNEFYEPFDLDEETVSEYLTNFDENYETTYILFIAYLEEEIIALKPVLDELDVELHLSFYVDKDYVVRAIDANYVNLDPNNSLDSIQIEYVVNSYKHGYIENPMEFDDTTHENKIEIETLLGDKNPVTIILNSIYSYIFK